MATSGFVPVTNVRHKETDLEFDIYGFHPRPKSVSRCIVSCSTQTRKHKVAELDSYGDLFKLDAKLFVTTNEPLAPHLTLVKMMKDVLLLSEDTSTEFGQVTVDGRTINVHEPLSLREGLIVSSLRAMAYLHRRLKMEFRGNEYAARVQKVWHQLECVSSEPDPFVRLGRFYDIHDENPVLSADCAYGEKLGPTPEQALWQAMVTREGPITQSALSCQTLHRLLQVSALCECACLYSGGAPISKPWDNDNKVRNLVQSLARKPYRHLLGRFVFEVLHGWGGMWRIEDNQFFHDCIISDLGMQSGEYQPVKDMITFCNDMFGTKGKDNFIGRIQKLGISIVKLLPFSFKGVGVRRIEGEYDEVLRGKIWEGWKNESLLFDQKCLETE